MTVIVLIVLIEKANLTIKRLLLGHYLFTDIVGTFLAYTMLPVVGVATVINASTFCLIFTGYLYYRRTTIQPITIKELVSGKK